MLFHTAAEGLVNIRSGEMNTNNNNLVMMLMLLRFMRMLIIKTLSFILFIEV